jgi:hypothetical protein
MTNMFSNREDAVVWLVVNGWRQNCVGQWLKGHKWAEIRDSPLKDGVVSIVIAKFAPTRR